MPTNTVNMALETWPALTDFFNHTKLAANFVALDAHDHTAGKGVQIPTGGIAALAVTTTRLADLAVTTGKLSDLAVTSAKLGAGAVTTAKLDTAAVTANELADLTVTKAKLAAAVQEALFQTGDLKPTARSVAPSGWLLCDGAAVSRTTYANLFAELGTTHGVGNGSTTFNVPDFRGRAPIGTGNGTGTNRVLADKGGFESHTLVTGQIPSHSHGGATGGGTSGDDTPDHGHGFPRYVWPQIDGGFTVPPAGGSGLLVGTSPDPSFTAGRLQTHTHSVPPLSIASEGGGGSHNNMQPYLVCNWLIKV